MRSALLALSLAALGPLAGTVEARQDEVQGPVDESSLPPIVRSVTVEGARRYTEQQLLGAFGVRVGERLDEAELRRGIRVLFDVFHVRAQVFERPAVDEAGTPSGVELRLLVEELALDPEPRFVGNVAVKTDKLLEWAGLEETDELFLYQAPRIRERLLRRYREEGYYFAEVREVERADRDEPGSELFAPDVVFEIREGPKVRVRDIVFHGNETLPNRSFVFFRTGLSKLAQAKLRGPLWLGLFPRAFDREVLDADVIAMREVYRDYGYLDAVVELDHLEFSEDRKWVTIHIAVDEGGRYTIGSISIDAVDVIEDPNASGGVRERLGTLLIPEEELLEAITLDVGETYERRNHAEDERALEKLYGDRGHVSHPSLGLPDRWRFLEPVLTFEADRPIVHVTYRIAQGRQIFIREIPITGNVHTRDRVVRGLLSVEPGDMADPDEIERSRARIQSTGYFSDRRVGFAEPTYRYLDTDDPNWKDLEFAIEEGQVLTFNISGAISSNNGLFGTVDLTMKNFDLFNLPRSPWAVIDDITKREAFHGGGQTLRLRASPGTERSFYDITFVEPDVLRTYHERISLSLNAQRFNRFYLTHEESRRMYSFRLGHSLSLDSSVYTGFGKGSVEVSDIESDDPPSIGNPLSVPRLLKEQEGTNALAYVELGYSYSQIDDRLITRNGVAFSVGSQLYDTGIGSAFDFVRSTVSLDWWDEFDEDPTVVSPYYHVQVSAGVAVPFNDTRNVPYTERFHLGGLTTLRGFRFRGVGPNENGDPIGGETMLHGTFEYRYPLVKQIQPGTYREYESFQTGVFFDWGVLDPDEFQVDVDELRTSYGILFGLTYPVPITFSFGWPIEEGPDDRKRVFGFSIGL